MTLLVHPPRVRNILEQRSCRDNLCGTYGHTDFKLYDKLFSLRAAQAHEYKGCPSGAGRTKILARVARSLTPSAGYARASSTTAIVLLRSTLV